MSWNIKKLSVDFPKQRPQQENPLKNAVFFKNYRNSWLGFESFNENIFHFFTTFDTKELNSQSWFTTLSASNYSAIKQIFGEPSAEDA